jgi:hypothetical protein
MNPFLELRARIEALEQLHKNNERFSLELLEARVKALEAAQNLRQRDKDVERAWTPAPQPVFKWQGGKKRAIIQPAGLVERVATSMHPESFSPEESWGTEARAAIREVADWLDQQQQVPIGCSTASADYFSDMLREEAGR